MEHAELNYSISHSLTNVLFCQDIETLIEAGSMIQPDK